MSNISLRLQPQTRAADVVMGHIEAAKVFLIFDIGLGLGETTLTQVAQQHGLSPEALIDLLHVTTGNEPTQISDNHEFISTTLLYLRRSHLHLRNTQIASLRNAIMEMEASLPKRFGAMLSRFFDSYICDVDEHFRFEEQTVFPYIEELLNGQHDNKFKINNFISNHTNIEHKLHDLKSILVKHLPIDGLNQLCFNVLTLLSELEADLNAHAAIEDAVLTPAVQILEQKGGGHV